MSWNDHYGTPELDDYEFADQHEQAQEMLRRYKRDNGIEENEYVSNDFIKRLQEKGYISKKP